MKQYKFFFKILVFSVVFLMLAGDAAAKKVLFYETRTAGDYKIETRYSKFKEKLEEHGYTVASITTGDLRKDKLESYDILIIPNMGSMLKIEEISAILWFVMQKGGGLFVSGGTPEITNQLTIPFGVTIDSGKLIDTTNAIKGGTSNSDFTVTRFNDYQTLRAVRQGVSKVGFYGGNGLFLSGNARWVAGGDSDTYSDTGTFPAGSEPPVAAAAVFGNGLIFVLSDADMLTNDNIEKPDQDNLKFGVNIVDWVGISSEPTTPGNVTWEEVQVIIGELKLENTRYQQQVNQLGQEKATLIAMNTEINSRLEQANARLIAMEKEKIGPFTPTNWAIIILGVCILLAAIIVSKRRAAPPSKETEELLGELSYELKSESGEEASGKDATLDLKDLGLGGER